MVTNLHTGVVHVNTYGGSDNTVPLGGYKQSGNGHDKSLHAIEKFINKKTAWIKTMIETQNTTSKFVLFEDCVTLDKD
jgi:acyl-CoA reductase-like NAD-dependent aldehyde dehydrogenase